MSEEIERQLKKLDDEVKSAIEKDLAALDEEMKLIATSSLALAFKGRGG